MKAAVLTAAKKPLTIEDVQVAKPLAHEVLIRTVACGVCRSDLHFVDGAYPHAMPCIPGHEAAGIVEAVGNEVRTVKIGDHVVTCIAAYCGHCDFCLSGRMSLCVGGDTRRGKAESPRLTRADDGVMINQLLNLSAFAEIMLVHEHACVRIDPDMPSDRAAILGCAVVTGAGAVFHAADITPGDSVCIVGCGGVGLAAVNAAKIAGAGRIIACDTVADKRDLAIKLGATDVIDAGAPDAGKSIAEMTKGGVDHAIEAVGRPASGDLAIASLKRGGTATILGMMPLDHRVGLNALELLAGKKVQGAFIGGSRFPTDIRRLVDFYMRGLLDLDSIIARRVPLTAINEAFDDLRTGDSVRTVVVFS
jgi:S-(hydroxymethyl)glutathione dehydrogenase / alcohol dehydrogenase